jgi:ABC-type multidrug transport system fused ATPase/permease subunit
VTPPLRPAPCVPGDISLSGARLRYDGGPWILDGFDLRLGRGEHVALVGPSGCGKSSVAHVLLRFRDLDGGRATMAGRDLRELDPAAVRRVIGLAAQDAHVFTTTIRENIRLARPGATQREIDGAARRAHILEWIEGLPEGWDTMVGEGGSRVSAGQRQRIALARALLADFPVLILDEPTANLDPPTARALIGDVVEMARGRTLLLITHRPEEAALMDRVVEMPAAGATPSLP